MSKEERGMGEKGDGKPIIFYGRKKGEIDRYSRKKGKERSKKKGFQFIFLLWLICWCTNNTHPPTYLPSYLLTKKKITF